MGQAKIGSKIVARACVGVCALGLFLIAFSATALAGPFHPRTHALDTTGLNHACGAAVDSKGDLYLASAGDSKIKVYNAAHTLLTEISDSNQPCGLAVTTTGNLYVTERATGEVVRFKPNAYPFAGTPTYGPREVIDSSAKAKGIAVDPFDNRLYVAEGDRVSTYGSEGNLGIDEVQKVSLNSGTTGGTFKLEFGGQKTAAIAFNASAEEVKTALTGLSTIGVGNVSIEKPKEKEYLVTFVGALAHTDVAMLVGDASGLTGTTPKVNITEKDKGFSGRIGEGTLTEASGVAIYSYPDEAGVGRIDRYLWVADASGVGADRLYLFGGADVRALALRREVDGATTPDGSFGFGTAGAYLAADPGNRNSKGECKVVGEQACTAGHLFLYDAAHKALDEFDATGEYLDRTANAAFADAEPTAIAIERSGAANDGTLYVTAGAGAGAKALAFGPLKAPSRAALGTPLSHILSNARAVATDSHGDVYAAAGSEIHIYDTAGQEITSIEDPGKPLDLAVDSAGNVYVLDENGGFINEYEVTYYAPSEYPPEAGTIYERLEPAIVTAADFPGDILKAIAVDPGSEEGKDRLFVTGNASVHEYDTAENGSVPPLSEEFGQCAATSQRGSLAVDGARGIVYIAGNPRAVYAVSEAGGEFCLARFENTGPSTTVGANPVVAVDQSNGHVITFDQTKGAREYDAAGSFVAEFGSFTESARSYRVAIDNACALHEPPLDETTTPTCKAFDPANGNVYIAYDDPNASNPPYDVTAFGPLDYGPTPPTPEYKLTVEKPGKGSGKVTSIPAGIDCGGTCSAKDTQDTKVTLSAEADSASESLFTGWTGCDSINGEGECVVSVTLDRKVKAEFKTDETEEFELKVNVDGSGSGTVSSESSDIDCPSACAAKFAKNSEVGLKGIPGVSTKDVKWTGCDSVTVENKCLVKMTVDREVTATFDLETPLLTLVKKGTGTGTVTSSPAGINCGPTCSSEFELNQEVKLTAEEDEGSKLSKWEGCDAEPSATECIVTMTKPRKVTATFGTLPKVKAKQAHPVLYGEATLQGEVDPSGLATKYHFEYLTEDEYDENEATFDGAKNTPVGELEPTSGFVAVEAPLTGLEEETEYHFRLFAENSVGSAEPGEDEGSFKTLQRSQSLPCPNTAYRFGLSAALPDCRAYELVTPAQTNGLTPAAEYDGGTPSGSFSNWFTVQRGEGSGERLSYFTLGTLPGFEGNGRLDGYRAERGEEDHPAGGWQSTLFSPGYTESAPGFSLFALQHGIAADQLYSIWESNPEPETFEQTLPHGVYLRTPAGMASEECNSPALESPQSEFELIGCGQIGSEVRIDPEALSDYASADGTHVIFTSRAHLEEDAPPASTQAVYDRAAGATSAMVVSAPPSGASPELKAEFESHDATYVGASEDGSAVAFRVGSILYLHRNGATVEIAAASSAYAGISEDGTRVFYADGPSAATLNACDTEAGPCAGPGSHAPAKIAGAAFFAGVSSDGSHAFFSSTEALGGEENENGEEAEAGARNLFAWDGTDTHFVGQLSSADFNQNAFAGISNMNLAAWTQAIGVASGTGRALAPTRSTPSGDAFVFQSHARLTAYDNKGVGEIYRYDPTAGAGQRLLCVSCDPSGAPPSADALLEDVRGFDFVPIKPKTMVTNLTDSGEEVFFQSFDQLLPEDANETEDVYEWRVKGSGSPECTRPGGCLALISSGQGETPSFLYAMSADGRDVFLHTKEKLVGVDVAGSPSIYDAREGGGIPEPTPSAPCQGDACQGIGNEPPVIPGAATTGAGEGNETPSPPARCAKGKHRVKGRCVRVKRHRHRHHRRAHSNRGGNR